MAGGSIYTPEEDQWLLERCHLSWRELESQWPFDVKRGGQGLIRHRQQLTYHFPGGREALEALQTVRAVAEPPKRDEELDALVLAAVRRAIGLTDLCNILDRSPATVEASIARLVDKGFRVTVDNETARIAEPVATGPVSVPLEHFRDGQTFRFGLVSDTHIGNKYARIDLLEAAYRVFQAEGISQVYLPGNWVDGYRPRLNGNELDVPPTFEAQVARFLDVFPQIDGIRTDILDGDDHEGWWAQDMGLEVGKRLIQSAHDRGRDDLHYLGYMEADIPLYAAGSDSPCWMRVHHPGGGSAYAVSYQLQKLIESYSSDEKPQILIIGHFHKAEYLYYRNVYAIQSGCMCDQTKFMRKKRLAAHTAFWIIEVQVGMDGVVRSVKPQMFPGQSRGYYQHLYAIGPRMPLPLTAG